MGKTELMGALILVGTALGVIALLLSAAYHKIHAHLAELEPRDGETFAETDKRFDYWTNVNKAIRVLGIIFLYFASMLMLIGIIGFAIAAMEGV